MSRVLHAHAMLVPRAWQAHARYNVHALNPPRLPSRASGVVRQLRCCATAEKKAAGASGASPGGGGGGDGGGGRAKSKKMRLDELCVQQQPQHSRNVIQSWIQQGKVLVDGKPVTKTGTQVKPDADVVITAEQPKYVCRAGLKMEAALDSFGVDPAGRVAMDSGLSTGGFTDCLLQRGAERVYGVDVGYGQVAERIRTHEKVVVMERTNLRHLDGLPEPVSLVTLDLSFISVLKVLPAVCKVLSLGGDLIVLIKPQFEARRQQISRGGLVRDPSVHEEVIDKVRMGLLTYGFKNHGLITSPIKGAASGNTEFLMHFTRTSMELPSEPVGAGEDDDEEEEGDGGDGQEEAGERQGQQQGFRNIPR